MFITNKYIVLFLKLPFNKLISLFSQKVLKDLILTTLHATSHLDALRTVVLITIGAHSLRCKLFLVFVALLAFPHKNFEANVE